MSIPGLTPNNQRAIPLIQRTLAAGSIGANYSLVGSIFSTPVVLLIVVSTLDEDVQLSLDGSTDFIPLVSRGLMVLDEKTNGIVLSGEKGVYVKRIGTPTSGSIYVGGFTIA